MVVLLYLYMYTQVQLQLLTAIVKLFLKRPADTQQLVQSVLSLATQESDNPDLRDRGYIYWRLLSTDPAAAKVRGEGEGEGKTSSAVCIIMYNVVVLFI